jgi:hypothetical protein
MPEQLVLHQTASIPTEEFNGFIGKFDEFAAQIPTPGAVLNSEVKHAAKMGDKKEADATAKLEALKKYNSFLPPQLSLLVMLDKLRAYKQSNTTDAKLTKIIDKAWTNGILGGIDLIAMLTLVDNLAETSAALGNEDAINYYNELEKIKAMKKVAEVAKKAGDQKSPKNPTPPKTE